MAVLVYVDDMILAGNVPSEIAKVKKFLASKFHMKDLANLKYFQRLEIAGSDAGIYICQAKYTLDLLTEMGMTNAKPLQLPMSSLFKLSSDQAV